jgi:pseudouridine-5'-phosphate glycosidase
VRWKTVEKKEANEPPEHLFRGRSSLWRRRGKSLRRHGEQARQNAEASCCREPKAGSISIRARSAINQILMQRSALSTLELHHKLEPNSGGDKGKWRIAQFHLTPCVDKAHKPRAPWRKGAILEAREPAPMDGRAYLSVSSGIKKALAAGQPVVALESTIITHGMPYPQNLAMAQQVEAVVREHGATPATIAIMDGRFCVGVSGEDLERLAQEGATAAKASRRDVSALLVKGVMAGTTVATTMQIAALAGISVFATGGIGGVHRGAEETFDISADLEELSRTPVAVVCAGAKSILDIAKTLEVLETNGVPVLGYRTDDFPAFWARQSGHKVDHRFDEVSEIARVIAMQADLGLGGVLIANPIPEAAALDPVAIEARIAEAIIDADQAGVSRKTLTPFLLKRVFELTGGKSLEANIELVKNNAAVAAQIAVALAERASPKPTLHRA